MKSTTATKTAPVIQNVATIVESIYAQFDAMGVHHQGLRRWNATEPAAIRTSMSATAILVHPCLEKAAGMKQKAMTSQLEHKQSRNHSSRLNARSQTTLYFSSPPSSM